MAVPAIFSAAVRANDLAPLVQGTGSLLTVYLTTEPDIENAAHRSEVRWRDLRRELADRKVPEATLAAIDPLVPEAHQGGPCLAAFAREGGLAHVEHGPEAQLRDAGRLAPLPFLLPLLEWRQSFPPHVVVLTDRTGADLYAYPGLAAGEIHEVVRGHTDAPLRKVHPGGWSQRRYQERAENTWEMNAGEVAKALTRMVEAVEPRLVVVAGDVRARQLLRDDVPKEVAERLQMVDVAGRRQDMLEQYVADEVRAMLAGLVAGESEELMGLFRQELGQQDRAANGTAATIAALEMGQIEVLLVRDDLARGFFLAEGAPVAEPTAWFGPEPTQVAAMREDLQVMGVQEPSEAPRSDVLVRSAIGTDAGIRIVPEASAGDLQDGVGALLRWSFGSSP